MLLGRAVGTPLSNRWATNPPISSGDRAASYKKTCHIKTRLLSIIWRKDDLLKVRGRDRPFTDIRMPVSSCDRWADLSKVEFFDAVACLEVGLAQFSNALGQCS
jgi:hypothetical protein